MRITSIAAGIGAVGLCTTLAIPAVAQSQELRVGFINTLSGGAAILGKAQMQGWRLGLAENGWKKDGDKFAGVPMKLFVGDDQRKVDVGLRVARRMVRSDKVHIVAGIIWSNILMAVQQSVIRSKTALLSTNAGATPMFGRKCSPYFISSSFVNDEASEAMGQLMNKEKIGSVFLMAPNYQAGKDNLSGFERFYKGKIAGKILFKIGARDYQAEISTVKAAKPNAVFIFAPGGMGIAFMKQWSASGANKDIKLYTVYTVDNITLRPIGKAAVGTYHTNFWSPDLDNPRNKKFVKDFMAAYKRPPDMFAAEAYDGAMVLAAGIRKLGSKVPKNSLDLVKAMRDAGMPSVRGDLKYNVNGALIQPYYKREVVLNDAGVPVIRMASVASDKKDSYWEQCPAKNRYPN